MVYISQLWIFFGALVSSNTLDRWHTRCTDVTIRASLRSEVSLPCHFKISHYNKTEKIKWSHHSSLVTITNNGIIYFDNPSEGRVSSFPNLARGGNFSILIHDLQTSDIGTYFCELNSECWRVKIMELPKTEQLNSNRNSWIFFFAGAGIFTLLFIIFNRTGLQNRLQSSTEKCMRSSKSNSTNEEHHEAFRNPDANDFTTSTVYYVIQA
ncbi:uncharacterized protein [Sinocyclocheilus grahami]|uniref:uncharacterized protein n=1 Tax=Sinocyclocheilus grahami TaxID=75366 RepID=UPI0007AD05B0|nr:PREDICTED: uncharacterized protein LOC107554246 [Sinocyclocheilus grahami]